MKIALLARNPNLYSHKRLMEAAEARGHQIDLLNTLRCTVHIASHKPEVYYDSEPCIGSSLLKRWGVEARFFDPSDLDTCCA